MADLDSASRDDLLAAIDRVRELHRKVPGRGIGEGGRVFDLARCDSDRHPWPCPTICALDGDDEMRRE